MTDVTMNLLVSMRDETSAKFAALGTRVDGLNAANARLNKGTAATTDQFQRLGKSAISVDEQFKKLGRSMLQGFGLVAAFQALSSGVRSVVGDYRDMVAQMRAADPIIKAQIENAKLARENFARNFLGATDPKASDSFGKGQAALDTVSSFVPEVSGLKTLVGNLILRQADINQYAIGLLTNFFKPDSQTERTDFGVVSKRIELLIGASEQLAQAQTLEAEQRSITARLVAEANKSEAAFYAEQSAQRAKDIAFAERSRRENDERRRKAFEALPGLGLASGYFAQANLAGLGSSIEAQQRANYEANHNGQVTASALGLGGIAGAANNAAFAAGGQGALMAQTQALEYLRQIADSSDVTAKRVAAPGAPARTLGGGYALGLQEFNSNISDMQNVGSNQSFQLAGDFTSGLAQSLDRITSGAQNAKRAFSDFALSFGLNIVSMINQLIALKIASSILQAFGFGASAGTNASTAGIGYNAPVEPTFGLASGGVLSAGSGVASSPTLLGNAVIGERGSEAVLPLSRMGDGTLGVRSGGGGGATYITIHAMDSQDVMRALTKAREGVLGLVAGGLMENTAFRRVMREGGRA